MALLARSLGATYYEGWRIERHAHAWGQLVFTARGVMRVEAEGAVWIVPPARAVWIPPEVEHAIIARGEFELRTVYIAPGQGAGFPVGCMASEVPALLRELILRIVRLGVLEEGQREHEALFALLLTGLGEAKSLPTRLVLPRDPRGRRAAARLMADPSLPLSLGALAREAGASARTLQRLFLEETGMGFAEWRRRARLIHSAALLGAAVSVTDAGMAAGYGSPSAFANAFRRMFGRKPMEFRARST